MVGTTIAGSGETVEITSRGVAEQRVRVSQQLAVRRR